MQKRFFTYILGTLLVSILFSLPTPAQTDKRPIEVGGFVTTVKFSDPISETPLGVGGRFAYNFTDNFALDSEVAYFPQNPSGNFGETIAVVGVKAGVRRKKFGAFAKFRPGIVRFGGDFFRARNSERSNLALDVGGVLEYYPTSRFIVRVDVGDTIIPFGDKIINNPLPPIINRPGTTHNLQISFGVGYRF